MHFNITIVIFQGSTYIFQQIIQLTCLYGVTCRFTLLNVPCLRINIQFRAKLRYLTTYCQSDHYADCTIFVHLIFSNVEKNLKSTFAHIRCSFYVRYNRNFTSRCKGTINNSCMNRHLRDNERQISNLQLKSLLFLLADFQ